MMDSGGTIWARARFMNADCALPSDLYRSPVESTQITDSDHVFVRLNPARFGTPGQIDLTLWILRALEQNGTSVVNPTRVLSWAANKAFLCLLPDKVRPKQSVVDSVDHAMHAIQALGNNVVIKPTRGTRGQGVIFLNQHSPNARSIVELALKIGPIVVQERMQSADLSDKRVLVLDGVPFQVNDQVPAIRRIPAPGDLRSNLHLGGRPELTKIDASDRQVIQALKPVLCDLRIRLAGIDILAGKVLEINVWSPGGLALIERFTGHNPCRTVMKSLLVPPSFNPNQSATR